MELYLDRLNFELEDSQWYCWRIHQSIDVVEKSLESAGRYRNGDCAESLMTASNNISDICARIPRNFGLRNGGFKEVEDIDCTARQPCWACRTNISSAFLRFVSKKLNKPPGICLQCFKHGVHKCLTRNVCDLQPNNGHMIRKEWTWYMNVDRWEKLINRH
jgi:hypothetical protein